jgi:hypothetical protein
MTTAVVSTPLPEPSPARVRRVSVKNIFGLERLGLLDADEQESATPSEGLQPDDARVLDLFASDLEHKLDVLEPLARSIELVGVFVEGPHLVCR